MFSPNAREKRKQRDADDEEAPKKKRRLQRRNGEDDPSESDAERRAAARRAKERERDAKIKSKRTITGSDDESDAEGDAEFFRLEEERRQKMKGIIRNQLLKEMGEVAEGDGKKGKKAKEKEVRAKARQVAMDLGEDEDGLVEGVVGDVVVGSSRTSGGRKKNKDTVTDTEDEDEDEDANSESDEEMTSRAPSARDGSMLLAEVSVNASSARNSAPDKSVVDDDDEDEDAPVSKRPPARRLRAGFVLDDSDDE